VSTQRINLIGGSAYSTTGGIQAVNRVLVRELTAEGLLRRAFFLWDDPTTASDDASEYLSSKRVRLFSLNRYRFIKEIFDAGITGLNDLWLCTHVNYALVGLCASLWRPWRVGVVLHAAELDEGLNEVKLFALRQVGFAIAVSEYTRRKAIKLGVKPSRIHVVLNGIDDPCPSWQAKSQVDASQLLLFVGRMDERYKGQMELLDAMTLLRERLPALRLVFVGGGRSLDEWRAEAHRRNLQGIVEFTGRVSDEELQRRYKSAAIFAMPSENEGFGLVYAEAMAHGIPCIGSDRDAAREVIVQGETGYCVPANNSTALADAITTILRDPPMRIRMAQKARDRFMANFAMGSYRRRILETMHQWQSASG